MHQYKVLSIVRTQSIVYLNVLNCSVTNHKIYYYILHHNCGQKYNICY